MHRTDRRSFIRNSLVASAALGGGLCGASRLALAQNQPVSPAGGGTVAPEGALPCGKIGDLSISRLLLGGNLLTHFTHSRDLQYVYNLCKHYNTDEKIIETLALAEQQGINALVVHTVPAILSTLRRYRNEKGGKIQWIICPTAPVGEDMTAYTQQVRELVENGTEAVYLWGVTADKLISEGKIDAIAKAVALVKDHGVPSGVGAHDLAVVKACEQNKVGADFYIKTFHHHNYPSGPKPDELKTPYSEYPGYWCQNPQEVIDFMKNVEKPWIAFKVMAAGAIPPKDAFPYVFNNGADHVLAGMFDFEITDDARIAREALASVNRSRPWRS
jgi:hypothetical protein